MARRAVRAVREASNGRKRCRNESFHSSHAVGVTTDASLTTLRHQLLAMSRRNATAKSTRPASLTPATFIYVSISNNHASTLAFGLPLNVLGLVGLGGSRERCC